MTNILRSRAAWVAFALLGSTACAGGPLDGTWLIQMDPNSSLRGDCAPDDDVEWETTYTGTDNMLLDVYSTEDGGAVVGINGVWMTGTYEDKTLDVTWEYSYRYEDTTDDLDYWTEESTELVLTGTLDGKLMTGSLENKTTSDGSDEDEYSCTSESDFTAEKVDSPYKRYVGE